MSLSPLLRRVGPISEQLKDQLIDQLLTDWL